MKKRFDFAQCRTNETLLNSRGVYELDFLVLSVVLCDRALAAEC
jgi:hypothetical protein